ncbi:MAG: rod shape-determining protein MreC [Opitutae bacterium]|nr:rod shape-determining protein MreC [Opitutae bacterium]
MPHKRFDQARPFATLGLVLLLWLLVPLAVKSLTRSTLFEIQIPIGMADSFVADLQNFWANRLHSKDELFVAGKKTAALIADYAFSAQENEQLRAEILRLENLLKLPPLPAHRLEPARVAKRDFTAWWQRLVIRKGRNYGIPVGAPVVFVGGVVGRVVEVHAYTAIVDLVSSPTFRIAASAEGDNRPISYQGGVNDAFKTPHGSVEFVPSDISVAPSQPKRLVTSGLGGVFPAGLTIGDIVHLEPSTDGLFSTGDVLLDNRLGALSEVTVLIPINAETP